MRAQQDVSEGLPFRPLWVLKEKVDTSHKRRALLLTMEHEIPSCKVDDAVLKTAPQKIQHTNTRV